MSQQKPPLQQLITVYGRKPVQEALNNPLLNAYKLHILDNAKTSTAICDITKIANNNKIPTEIHSRNTLSRISKNSRQDQGVALDIYCPLHQSLDNYLEKQPTTSRLLILDGVTNPQNVGMMIRSIAAGYLDGIIIPRKGCTSLGPLVIKASAGTLFSAPILSCETTFDGLQECKKKDYAIYGLDAAASQSIYSLLPEKQCLFVLGNETEGISQHTRDMIDHAINIPMRNNIESLNVAVTASLIAFLPQLIQ